jgi:hypothetical protein
MPIFLCYISLVGSNSRNIFKILLRYPLTQKAYTTSNFENIENIENTMEG